MGTVWERPNSSTSTSSKRASKQETQNDVPSEATELPPQPKRRPWDQRPRSPGLKWYKEYDTLERCRNGRVLLIDYVKQDHSKEGMRKVAAQEIDNIEGLRKIYASPDRGGEAVLRVFHVQNAYWATHFLLRKFNINAHDDLVGTDFGKYVRFRRPERRGGKCFLSGKSWKTTHDPWRGISRTSFGIDYLKQYRARNTAYKVTPDLNGKMMELNCYDDEDNPTYGWDVYVQRISCYIQHKESFSEIPDYPDIDNPYTEGKSDQDPHRYVPHLETLDNGNTIIIFENSQTGSIEDTLITARQQWESRWRRLPFYLAYESHDVSNDDRMALECMKIILQDVWKSVADTWEGFIDVCNNHVSILEDKIYEEPADETRAPELWTNSNMWLKVERLISIHMNVVKEMQNNLRELTGEPKVEDNWLESSPDDLERVGNLVQEDLVKPTANLADLMYKSVGIRDSRHSLQLSTSMWRLSWITFVFLPLTFIVGFFGMNVDTFANDPSIKWYFVAAVPVMTGVLILWYVIKHLLARDRQSPYSRGVYERLFQDLATTYPLLWSRSGPRELIKPQGTLTQLKWHLILYWNSSSKTIKAGISSRNDESDDLGAWSHLKRSLTRKWTSQIRETDKLDVNGSAVSLEDPALEDDAVRSGIQDVTELLALPGGMLKVPLPSASWGRQYSQSPNQGSMKKSSRGSSPGRDDGVMVEEERPTWLQELGGKSHNLTDWVGAQGAARRGYKESRRAGRAAASPGSLSKDDSPD